MKRKDEIRNELQELGLEKLAALDCESGFKVPEGYFDALENSIMNNLPTIEAPKIPSNKWLFNIKMVSSIAASVLILIVFGVGFLFLKNGKENGSISQLPDYAYEDYFASLNDFERLKMKEYLIDLNDIDAAEGFYDQDDEHLLEYLSVETNYQKFDPMTVIDLDDN